MNIHVSSRLWFLREELRRDTRTQEWALHTLIDYLPPRVSARGTPVVA